MGVSQRLINAIKVPTKSESEQQAYPAVIGWVVAIRDELEGIIAPTAVNRREEAVELRETRNDGDPDGPWSVFPVYDQPLQPEETS